MLAVAIWSAAVLAVLFWVRFAQAAPSWPKSLAKTGSVGLLALAALGSGAPGTALALSLGTVGDFCLSRPGTRWFLAGMAAFGSGHLVYAVLFLGIGPPVVRPVATGALLVFGAAMGALLWRAAGALRGPVLAYVAVILAMGLAALGLPAGQGGRILPATLLFLLSDSLLAAELFLVRNAGARRMLGLAVWPCYWLAQLGLLAGLAGPGLFAP